MSIKLDFMVAILWFICIIIDISNMTAGEQPSWLNMIMAHVCLVLCNIEIGLKRKK